MDHTPSSRFSPAKIVLIFLMVVLFASTAWAEVLPVRNSPKSTQLSFTQAVALTAGNQGVSRETPKLRIRLIKEKREARREARRKRRLRLGRIQTASGAGTTSTASYSGQPDWDAIAACESGDRWDLNTGNGYWGGLQFAPGTWFAYGGGSFDGSGPFPYSRDEQIAVANRILAAQGPGAWPVCFRYA
jgi:hypothetical protein